MADNFTDTSNFEIEKLTLHGRKLQIKDSNTLAIISKNQRKLILCLMQEINEKKAIIDLIWGGKNSKSTESNYNQLVYQTRALLVRNGFPDDLIITIHRYGLCLNQQFLKSNKAPHDPIMGICDDSLTGDSAFMDIERYMPGKENRRIKK